MKTSDAGAWPFDDGRLCSTPASLGKMMPVVVVGYLVHHYWVNGPESLEKEHWVHWST